MDQNLNNPLISIIMPAYNAAKFIGASIKCVIDQQYQNWELIVINDGSTDKTSNIVDGFIQNDNRITIINQANKKLGAARNAGVKVSNGEWICFLDADDIWLPQKLQKQVSLIKSNPADLYYSDGYVVDEKLNILSNYNTLYGFSKGLSLYQKLYSENIIPVLSVMVRSEIFKKIGYNDEPLIFGCEDWDYWLRLSRLNIDFYGYEEKLFYYRKHEDGLSGKSLTMQVAQATVLLSNFSTLLNNREEKIDELRRSINPFIVRLLNSNKETEATKLLFWMKSILKGKVNSINYFLAKRMGKRSVYLIRAIMKIENLTRW